MAQQDGSIQIVGDLDLSKVEKSVESLETKIRESAIRMGVSVDALTNKLKSDFENLNNEMKKAGNDAVEAAGSVGGASEELDDLEDSFESVTAEINQLRKSLRGSKIDAEEYTEVYKQLTERLSKVAQQANLTGAALAKATPLTTSQEQNIRAGNISSSDIGGYNIPELKQAELIMTNLIEKEGLSLENQQQMINLRAQITQRLKDSLKTEQQLSAEAEKQALKEAASAKKVAEEAAKITVTIDPYQLGEKNLVEITEKIKAYKKALEQLENPTRENKATAESYRKELDRLERQMGEITGQSTRTQTALSRLNDGFKNLMTRMAFYVSVGALTGFAKQIIQVRGEFEKTTTALGAIIKDFDRANELFLQIQESALKSPFTIMELTTSIKQLAAYNVGLDDLHSTMTMLADLSAGVGVEMQRLVVNYGQIKALGVANNRELKDFAVAGLPVYEELAKRFTTLENRMVSAGEVFERVSNRMVSFQDVQAVLEGLTEEGGRFYNIQEEMAKTLAGKLSNLTDAYQIMYNEIGQRGQAVITAIIDLLMDLAKNWEDMIPLISGVAGALAVVGGFKVIQGLGLIASAALKAAKSLQTLKAASIFGAGMLNPWMALISILAAITTGVISARKEANRLKSELDSLFNSNISEADNLIVKFDKLTSAIVNSIDGSTEQRVAYEQLQRTFGDILPQQSLEIDNLKNQKDGYIALTQAIRENITERNKEKALSAIGEAYSKDFEKYTQKSVEILQEDLGITSKEAHAILQDLKNTLSQDEWYGAFRDIDNRLVDIIQKNTDLKDLTSATVKNLRFWGDGFQASGFQKLINIYASFNKELAVTEERYKASDTALGRLSNEWEDIIEKAKEYRIERETEMKNFQQFGGFPTTEFDFKVATNEGELQVLVDGVNKILKENLSEVRITADTDTFTKEFKDSLQTLDPTTRALVQKLIENFSALKGKLLPTEDFELTIKAFEDAISKINGSVVDIDTFSNYLKGENQTFSDWINSIHSLVDSQAGYIHILNQQKAQGKNINEEDLLIEKQKLEAYEYIAKLYPKLEKGSKDQGDSYSKELSLIKDLVSQFRELAVVNQDLEKAAKGVESSYGEIFDELFKANDFDIASLLTFDDAVIISALEDLQKELDEKSKEAIALGKFIAEYKVNAQMVIDEQKYNEAKEQIAELFETYKVGVEIETMGEYGDLMANIFDIDKIDLNTLESRIKSLMATLQTEYSQTLSTLEAQADIETDPQKKSELEATIAAMKLANKERLNFEEETTKKIKELRIEEFKTEINAQQEYLKQYGTYQQQKLAITRQYSGLIAAAEGARREQLISQQDLELSKLNTAQFAENIDWGAALSGAGYLLGNILEQTLRQSKDYLNTDEFRQASIEDKKTIMDAISEMEDVLGNGKALDFEGLAKDMRIYQNSLVALENAKTKEKKAIDQSNEALEDYTKALKSGDTEQIASAKIAYDSSLVTANAASESVKAMTDSSREAQQIVVDTATSIKDNMDKAVSGLSQIFSGDSLSGIWQGIIDVGDAFSTSSDGIKNAAGKMADDMKSVPIVGWILSIIDLIKDGVVPIVSNISDLLTGIIETAFDETLSGDIFFEVQDLIVNLIKSIIQGIIDSVKQLFSGDALKVLADLATFGLFDFSGRNEDDFMEKSIAEQERLEKLNSDLQHSYDQLGRAAVDAMGDAEIAAQKAAIAQQELIKQNLILQKQEVEKQIAYQKSLDYKDGTDKDEERDDTITELESQLQGLNQEIDNMANEIEDAISAIVENLLGSDLKDAAENWASSFIDTWRSGEDPFTLLEDQFDDMIDNMIVKSLASKIVADNLKKVYDAVAAATEDTSAGGSALTEEEIKEINALKEGVVTGTAAQLEALMKALGIEQGLGSEGLSALQKGISGITEKQASALESLWTTTVAKTFELVSISTNQLAVQNSILNEIRQNGRMLAAINELIKGVVSADGLALSVDLRN